MQSTIWQPASGKKSNNRNESNSKAKHTYKEHDMSISVYMYLYLSVYSVKHIWFTSWQCQCLLHLFLLSRPLVLTCLSGGSVRANVGIEDARFSAHFYLHNTVANSERWAWKEEKNQKWILLQECFHCHETKSVKEEGWNLHRISLECCDSARL